MKRGIIVAMMGILLAVGLAFVLSRAVGAVGPVYTVAELRSTLALDPQAWLGRMVLVRGTPMGSMLSSNCPTGLFCAPLLLRSWSCSSGSSCAPQLLSRCPSGRACAPRSPRGCPLGRFCWPLMLGGPLSLVDSAAPGAANRLLLVVGSPDRLLTFLRGLPLVGRYMPGPQRLRWGEAGIYRVVLRATPSRWCGGGTCYEAVLPDAAPIILNVRNVISVPIILPVRVVRVQLVAPQTRSLPVSAP